MSRARTVMEKQTRYSRYTDRRTWSLMKICLFRFTSIHFFGEVIFQQVISLDPRKVQALTDSLPQKPRKEMSFLDVLDFYKRTGGIIYDFFLFPYNWKTAIKISSERCVYLLKLLINLVQLSVWSVSWSDFNEIGSYNFLVSILLGENEMKIERFVNLH